MGAYNSILLKREFEVSMSADFLSKILASKNDSDFRIDVIYKYNFKAFAYSSIGTISGLNPFTSGIKIFVKFQSIETNKTLVTIRTKLRIEFYFIAFVLLLFIIADCSFKTFSILTFLIFPIITVWFWLVYRSQENELANTVENYLIKQPRMGWPDLQ